MKNVVIVGAGKEGKGTFGDIFYENKWNITFIDKDENVINSLNEKNSYIVEALYENYNEKHIIDHYHAYLIDDYTNSYESILNADVIVLALYPEDIKEALSKLKFSLQKRIKSNYEQKLTILCGTNKNHMMSKLENFLLDDLKIEKEWYCSNVALRDMIIRRSSNSDAKDAVQLTTKIVQTLLIQSPVYFDVSKFKWFELNNNLEMMKDIKLFTYNSPHAACAYVGYKHGYQTIEEASKNKDIKTIMEACVLEAKKGILSSFEITAEELDDFVEKASDFSHIQFMGLMTSAPVVDNPEENRPIFAELRKLSVDIARKNAHNMSMSILSMGMTNDYEVAIEEGATMVRVGTAIFGARNYAQTNVR